MVYFILQIIGFILCIILVHYLWNILKETFTIKKTKDLNTTIEKYKSLMEHNFINNMNNNNNTTSSLEEIELIESDLNMFLDEIISKNNNLVNNI
jgi:hypothetical protein